MNSVKVVFIKLIWLSVLYISTNLITPIVFANNITYKSNSKVVDESICLLSFQFKMLAKRNKQTIELTPNVRMLYTTMLAVEQNKQAAVASNVSCQQLIGTSYTGSGAEWEKFFESATQGLIKADYKELTFTLVGEDDKVFDNSLIEGAEAFIVKEYTFTGVADGNKQIIKNLALLDKKNNTVYTFSVSGNVIAEAEINNEFTRLLASIKK